jgi:cation:H+ antiporter
VSYLLIAAGIVMLGLGASWLVDGACRVALRLGVSPLVVGLTVVGFGTSMPEFMVSVLAAGHGKAGLSLGNAVGSNVMNLLLVLGVAALLRPIRIVGQRHEMRRDVLFGLAPVPILMLGAWNGFIGRLDAMLLLVVFALFIGVTLSEARRNRAPRQEVEGHVLKHVGLAVVGIVVLSAGAESLVRGGTEIARTFGISEAVIGLTLVAFGTSLPELAASVAASVKGQSEMSIGNVLG